jgi:hypothetical protein
MWPKKQGLAATSLPSGQPNARTCRQPTFRRYSVRHHADFIKASLLEAEALIQNRLHWDRFEGFPSLGKVSVPNPIQLQLREAEQFGPVVDIVIQRFVQLTMPDGEFTP